MASMTVPSDSEVKALAAENNWQEIASRFGDVRPGDVDNTATAISLYRAWVEGKDDARSEAWLDRILALAPNNSTYWRNKGNALQRRAEHQAALECYRRAIDIRPDLATYHASAGFALYQLGEHESAIRELETAVAGDPNQRGWWIRLARARVLRNELAGATEAYGKALALLEDAGTRATLANLERQAASLANSKAASPAYYDAVFTESSKYARPGEATSYADIWTRIADLLRAGAAKSILDLGCGPGQFAEFLTPRLPGVAYCGVDFSGVAIAQARRRNSSCTFEQRDLPLADFDALPSFDAVLCTEVLEHVEDDLGTLAVLPAGTAIFATVPSVEAFDHLRQFPSEADVRNRYGHLLDEMQIEAHQISSTATIWLLYGRRRADASNALAASSAAVGKVDLPAHVVDSVFLMDGTHYVEHFLPQFGLPFLPLKDTLGLKEGHVALRHDVDWSIENAYAMAICEHQLGVRSTYFLLHPDGDIQRQNYFGRVEGDKLAISPQLFTWARKLVDLGHEVGLHNDLITLALNTGRQPAEFLEQIVEAFHKEGIALEGSATHGSRRCHELGYMNFQLFAELADAPMGIEQMNLPESVQHFARPIAELRTGDELRQVEKFKLRMADYGLKYEANFLPCALYLSDSSARWTLREGSSRRDFERGAPAQELKTALSEAMARNSPLPVVQCLVHPCHWGPLTQFNEQGLAAARSRRDTAFGRARCETNTVRLAECANVICNDTNARFDGYDQAYGANRQLYTVASTVVEFVDRMASGPARHVRKTLEIGCGQGDFLHLVDGMLRRNDEGSAAPLARVSVGVDGSSTAILDCAARYPDILWGCTALEDFVEKHDDHFRRRGAEIPRYDLVLDKTGAIAITTAAEARALFAAIDKLMASGSLYVYVASRHYYFERLSRNQYARWDKDWMSLISEYFEPVSIEDDEFANNRGYIKRIWRKR